jgi:GR25 family glycosyltransferase involved in LPS biosynthesis
MHNIKTRIIVLKNNKLSETNARDCIEQAAKFGISAEVFDAINGFDADRHLELLNIRPLGKFKKGRVGIVGCLLSHYYLWLDCIKDNVPYLILEHDGYFVKPLPENILDSFDDIIKLDAGNPYSGSYDQWLTEHENDNPSTWTINDCEGGGGTRETRAGWSTRGTWAYIIKPHAAEKIVAWVKQNGFLPSDHLLGTKVITITHHKPTIVRIHPYYAVDGNIKKMSTTMNLEQIL